MRFIALVLLGILMLGSAPAEAASAWQNLADPVFVRADGRELPEAAVMAVAQDRAGFLWIGTQGGLGRFDGYHFRNFLADAADPDALPDGYVRTLLGGSEGGVWIGSSSSGLVHFDAATETFHTWRPDPAGRRGPRSASVDAIVPAGRGALWVGGDGGLDRFDVHSGAFTPAVLAPHGPQPVIWSLLVDRAGTVWAGTQDGLFARPAGAAQFREYPLHAAGISKPAIYSIAEDRAGRLWAGSVNVLFVLDAAHRSVQHVRSMQQNAASLAPGQQWSLIEMTPGVMWAGTDAAISIVDAATLRVHRVVSDVGYGGGLSSGRALQFLRDRSGLVWVANHVGGLLLFNPFSTGLYEISTTRAEIGFTEKGAVALAALPGNHLWVGGFAGRLAEFAAHPAPPMLADVPNRAAVQALLVDRNHTLWLGTTGGLCRLRPGSKQAECPARPTKLTGASIYALEEDGPRLWVGGSAGLFTEDLTSGAIAPFPPGGREDGFSNSQVRVLFYDRKGRLWVGTENGLDRVDPGGAIQRFAFAPDHGDSIGPGGMATLLEDRRGRIWAGASGGPLDVITEDARGHEHFRHIGIANGMPHENVDGIAEDARGRMWASTDRGIARIAPDTLKARAFGLADGVSDGAYWAGTVSQTADGTIFFGGLDGITVIAPDAASPWTYAPPVVVSALHVGRRNIPAAAINRGDSTIDLPANARDINVEFSALDFSAPQSLRYSYKLDGYDRDWIDADTQHRNATYTHLSPGDYTLEVRGSNRLGLWSRHVLRIGVRAQPAWFETWWFRLLLGLVCVLAAYGAHRMRTGVLHRRQSELEGLVSERTHALSDANVKLQELSLSDPLTGLRNRRFLAQHIDADVAVALRRYDDWRTAATGEPPYEADLLFFLIDLDHLKAINDQYGHHSGDTVLIQMRDRLHEVFRESDFIVRWGGDEFLAVARGSRRIEAAAIAERICQAVGRRPFELGGSQELQCSVSVGFAAYPFVQAVPAGLGWPDIVGIADQALYKAKQSGRNNWFGLVAGRNADPAYLARQLESDADEAVSTGALRVVTREGTPVG